MKINIKKEWILWLLVLAPILYIVYIWNLLPEQIPTHWNYKNEIDAYSGKSSIIIFPAISIGIYLLLLFVPLLDPKKANYDLFTGAYYGIRVGVLAFLDLLFISVMHATLSKSSAWMEYIPSAVCLLFAIIGYYMKGIKPNYFVGIRTPWTIESPEVWEKTHMMGSKLWLYGGLITFVLCLFTGKYSVFVLIPSILILAFVPMIYSYLIYKKLKTE